MGWNLHPKSNREKICRLQPVCFYMTFAFWRRKNSWFWLEKLASFQPDKDAVLSQKVVDASQTRRSFWFGGMGGVGVFLVGAFRGWSPLAWHDMTYICKYVRRSSSFFFPGGSFYGRFFDVFFFEFWISVFLSKLFLECSTFCFGPLLFDGVD